MIFAFFFFFNFVTQNVSFILSRLTIWTRKLANHRHVLRHCYAVWKPIMKHWAWMELLVSKIVHHPSARECLQYWNGHNKQVIEWKFELVLYYITKFVLTVAFRQGNLPVLWPLPEWPMQLLEHCSLILLLDIGKMIAKSHQPVESPAKTLPSSWWITSRARTLM